MTRRPRIDDLTALALPCQPALSPDGAECVYVLRTADGDAHAYALWRVATHGGAPRRLTHGPGDSAPAWAPDGSRVAFLRRHDGPAQVWSLPADGGEPEPLTVLPLGAGAPVWSPDGTRIAFTAPVDRHAVTDDRSRERAARAAAPIVARRLDHQVDGVGPLRAVRSHVHVLNLATGACRQVTDGDWHASGPVWSPDSTRLAFAAATAADADLVVRVPVHVLDVCDPLAVPRLVGLAEGVGSPVAWTADGTALLVVGRTDDAVRADGPVGHANLLRLPLESGPVVDLTAALDRNVMPGATGYPGALPQLTAAGTVLLCLRERGDTHVHAVPVGGGPARPVVAGAGRSVSGMSVAAGTAVVALATPTAFGELVAVDLTTGTETVLTDHGLHDVEPFVREGREFAIGDGTRVHGWLLRDPAATGAAPLLLDVHGGPHNAWGGAADEVHLYHQELVARGWTVLLINPRGSDGYGEEFYRGVIGGWGDVDARDLLEPVDELVALGIADPRRLAVTGYSYGGFMTCYLTGRDGHFAAAVGGGVISDLVSAVGAAGEGHVLSEYLLGGQPWEIPERYRAMSPINRVDRVRTPTLILQGADDVICPVGQAEQWHTALRERGVPTGLVLYPGAAHPFLLDGRPSHRLAALLGAGEGDLVQVTPAGAAGIGATGTAVGSAERTARRTRGAGR